MKASIPIERAQIELILSAWAESQGWKLLDFELKVELGDPGDPREAGHRREYIDIDVDLHPTGPVRVVK